MTVLVVPDRLRLVHISCIDLTFLQFYLLTWTRLSIQTDLINPILVDNNVVYSIIEFSYLHIDFYCAATYRVSFLFLLFAIPIYKHYQLSNKNTWFNKLMKDRGRICQTTFFSSVLSGNTGVIYVISLFQFQVVHSCAIITHFLKTLFS